jgi:hypothetical protein
VKARTRYVKQRNKVLDIVVERRGAISETIADLRAEDTALAAVQTQASNGTQ